MGRIGFPDGHLKENICEAMKAITQHIPRGWRNIQSIHVKSVDSVALPVYNSLPPKPLSLSSVGEGPKVKRVKLTEVRIRSIILLYVSSLIAVLMCMLSTCVLNFNRNGMNMCGTLLVPDPGSIIHTHYSNLFESPW